MRTHRLRCRSADVFWISVLLLLGEELLGAGSVAYVCAAAAVGFTEEKRHLRGQQRYQRAVHVLPARMVCVRSEHARRRNGGEPMVVFQQKEWPRDTRGCLSFAREQRGAHIIAPDREYWRSSSLPSKRFGLYRAILF